MSEKTQERTETLRRQAQELMRDRLALLEDCTLEWVSSGTTETVGEGQIYLDIKEQSEQCVQLLSQGDGLTWIDSYIQGHWSSQSLLSLMAQLVRARQLDVRRSVRWMRPIVRLYHRWRHETLGQVVQFLGEHHELSEQFFAGFLDKKYQFYGSALYPHPQASLEQAVQWQLQRCCEKLNLMPGDTLLDWGSGWGSLGLYAAQHYGAQVTVVAYSPIHAEKIRTQVMLAQMEHLVTVQSYEEAFDGSQAFQKIGVFLPFNLIGHLYTHDLMQQAADVLAPEGLILVQTIAQNHPYFGSLLEGFMQRYVFQYYSITSLPHMMRESFDLPQLRLLHTESLDDHCARTIRDWYLRFQDQRDLLIDKGITPQFLRLYEMKMAMLYAGVCSRDLQCLQMLWGHQKYRGDDWLLSHSKSSYFPSPYLPEYDKS